MPDAEKEHTAPPGIELVPDTPEMAECREASGYVEFEAMAKIPTNVLIIRCASCIWYRKEDGWCTYEENDYQCNGPIGCCDKWDNPNARMWQKEEG